MVFLKRIKTIRNNKPKLVEWLGYTDIDEVVLEGEFENRRDAYRYAKTEYNNFVDSFNENEKNRIIVNPITGNNIKKYSIYKLNGTLKKKYRDNLIIENGILKVNPVIIGIKLATLETAKINLQETDDPQLLQIFGTELSGNQIKADSIINGIEFKHAIPPEESVDITLQITFKADFSSENIQRTILRNGVYSGEELSDPLLPFTLIEQDDIFSTLTNIEILDMNILSSLNNATMELTDMVLREAEPLSITSLYNETIDNKNGHCIHDYMTARYPKLSKDKILKLKNTNDIYEWCKSYDIKMVAHDINCNVIKSHYPTKKTRNKHMIFISFNNHLYPQKNQTLHKVKIQNCKVVIIENVKDKLISELESGNLPRDVVINKDGEIGSFISTEETIQYTNNTDYYNCIEVLAKFGLKDKMTISTQISHLGKIIETVYNNKTCADSFFPYGQEFNHGGYNYTNLDIELEENEIYQTCDKNKSYPYNLASLSKLIVCDIKYHKSRKICEITKKHDIKNTYLYAVEIDHPTILLPNNHIYTGLLLNVARKNNFKFRIVEELETDIIPNYFKEMVYDLYNKVDNATFKEILNIHIGKFECTSAKFDRLSFEKILGKEELKCFDGHTFPLTEEFSIGCQTESTVSILNKKPISIQIKDASRIQVYNMMKNLGLKNSDIKQVKTDAITFKTKDDKYKKWINNGLTGWKTEEFKPLKKLCIMKRDVPTFQYKTYSGTDYDNFSKSGIIGLGNAGNGKTFQIINDIIPSLGNNNYIVLTPSHATLTEYKKLNLNCDVIQTYTYSKTFPEEQTVIIDEIGMVDNHGWDILVKCKLLGKNIMVFGDNTQLKPVNSKTCTNQNFFNLMFNTQIKLNKNYRNNFTTEYYDYLRAMVPNMRLATDEDKDKRLQEVLKHNTPFDKAEVIIAFTNKTRALYNEQMCKKLGITEMTQIGTKVICKTNKFRKMNIYNNFIFTVKDYNNEDIIINDGIENYNIPIKDFNKLFDYAYCRTLHSVQGQSLDSLHYAIEDIDYLNGTALYTLISRLKQEIK
tara:strand:+ start:120 stop:3233 length:3114 start_codon:yes stop_codon:yes gene_type:complete